MIVLSVGEYLSLAETAYKNKGGIEGQRSKLTTKTAQTIRQRMVDDVARGAVLPPVVVGYQADFDTYEKIRGITTKTDFLNIIRQNPEERLSIIDGMQRTTALKEAIDSGKDIIKNNVRVEFWVALNVNSLIYRMLVLNTGQVPWEIGRQLETVYGQIVKEIREKIGPQIEIFAKDDNRRRRQHSQYQGQSIIELFIVFSSKKAEVDLRDKISEDFARMNAIESTAHSQFLEYFTEALLLLTTFDKSLSRFSPKDEVSESSGRIREGKDIFNSFPAMAGFCAACSLHLFDAPGFETDWNHVPTKMEELRNAVTHVCELLDSTDSAEAFADFLRLQTLNELLSRPSGQVGRFEREFFTKAFAAMITHAARLQNFEPVWMAH
jgi:hypothetical protein